MAHPALALRRGQADCQSLTFCTLPATRSPWLRDWLLALCNGAVCLNGFKRDCQWCLSGPKEAPNLG